MAGDQTDPFIRLAELYERQLTDAAKQRTIQTDAIREQTEAVRSMADAMLRHNEAAALRHSSLLEALTRQNEGAKAAVDALVQSQSWPQRAATAIARELWPTFRTPVGLLVTAICAYLGWRFFQIPATPTPVQFQTAAAAEAPQSEGAAEEDGVN